MVSCEGWTRLDRLEDAMIRFEIPGVPIAKGRARVGMVDGKARMFTPPKTVAYEGLVALAGQTAMAGRELFDGPLELVVVATFPIPPSWSKKRQAAARYHIGRPDADNIAKAIGDGLNGVVWKDDSQIARMTIDKQYGTTPCVAVMVRAL